MDDEEDRRGADTGSGASQEGPKAPAARPVDPEREKKIAAAKAMAAKVAAARAAAATPPAGEGGGAAPRSDRPVDPERAAKIAAAKAMAAKVAAARGAGTAPAAGAPAAPARPTGPAPSSEQARVAAAVAARSAKAAASTEDPDVVNRRYVLRWLLWGSVAAWFGLAGGTAVAMFWPNHITGFGGIIPAGPTNLFPSNVKPPVKITEAHAYIVNPGPGIIALWWKCVHLGCTVPWVPAEDHFHCPCHGSVYLYDGQRIAGPAPRSMDMFPVLIKGGKVFINTNPSMVFQRLTYQPSQCTPLNREGKWSWTKGHTL